MARRRRGRGWDTGAFHGAVRAGLCPENFMPKVRHSLLAAALCVGVTAPLQAQTTPPSVAPAGSDALPGQLADFDAYVDGVRKAFDVPGIAVAIVKDGRIVLERGYGPRTLGKPEPIDAHTLFAIASNTKAFTAASLSMLADEGK